MTYESASEAEILKALWRPGAPLENTVFAILDPWGKVIVRGGRGPGMLFRDSQDMASTLEEIARYYNKSKNQNQNKDNVRHDLPAIESLHLAVNVAACEGRPLAIVIARTEDEQGLLAEKLAGLAWSDDLIGKLIYAKSDGTDLRKVKGASLKSGYIIAAPGTFGVDAEVLAQISSSASLTEIKQAAKSAIQSFHPRSLGHHNHVFEGRQRGIEWKSTIPVTDPHALRAQYYRQ